MIKTALLLLLAAAYIQSPCVQEPLQEYEGAIILDVSERYCEANCEAKEIYIYDADDLTAEILENRDGAVIIERIYGVVLDAQGNGKILNPAIPAQDYISYRSVNGAEVGDLYASYMIYDPATDYVDDIMERYDVRLYPYDAGGRKGNEIRKRIR